jgi:hypothetical protein
VTGPTGDGAARPETIVHYAVWPQGMADEARFTTSSARAFLLQNVLGLALVDPFREPRRILTTSCRGSRPDPNAFERSMARRGLPEDASQAA